jgi:LAS superfamily LD-carboxypeptidase LdcB
LARRGLRAVVTSGYRSLAKQARLYEAYRRGGPLAARPGSSAHNYGLAVDIAFPGRAKDDSAYKLMHRIAGTFGLQPLGFVQRRQDPYHVELPGWREWVKPRG